MKTYEIKFSNKTYIENQGSQSTYHPHHLAKCYARMALDSSLSRIIIIKHYRKLGKLRISVYKVFRTSQNFVKVYHLNCKNYRKYLNILTIQKYIRKKFYKFNI